MNRSDFARDWDLIVIGGGITGAGILLEAARRGLKVLLVEQRDFAWGTSSRSSKLVHGGLRYLKQGQFGLTRESVHEREHLLRQAAGLVEPQSFAFGDYVGRKPGKRAFLAGLAIYDRMAGQRGRHYYSRDEFAALAPNVATDGLQGGMVYTDAKTDDARLVLRVLQEARTHGAVALNYMAVVALLHTAASGDSASDVDASAYAGDRPAAADGVRGVRLRDGVSGMQHEVRARMVINAAGAWADQLRATPAAEADGRTDGHRLRPLRGSHLVLAAWRLPLAQAISLMHPADGRPVFAYPWEGVTLVGTTDVDHSDDLSREASITRSECDYLLAALQAQFPQLHLNDDDIIATYAGVRPVIDSGNPDPSKETRDHALWLENGLLTVTGGKLTTFRVIALDALKLAAKRLPELQGKLAPQPVFAATPALCYTPDLPPGQAQRLQGRYGAQAQKLVDAARPGELAIIPGTETIWGQLRWAARHEDICKLEDLLLRRTRIGIQLRGGGIAILPRIRAICQPELGWDDQHWEQQQAAYLALWQAHYSVPK
ncbi:glycerol-3-phosphate dehydrogenase/oxidase [Duganella sp. sic0402]|uniref:glycerol-3-phosphate dehydrogenase/oxidase n=1 Tax=Duganella sp. sic0402 TaxID=2854786 RepID=UPI001C4552AE|nr:glycerol-3-phosphate dehydrogenase/oxidase [Duganella sp. sic0402]MBV7535341.1 glycerol-3-phosphate dehydrogenase/oxidase [Duganella sp. sic0402]